MPDISIVAVVEVVIEGSMDEVAIVIQGSMDEVAVIQGSMDEVAIVIFGSMDEVAIGIEGSMAPDGMNICAKPLLARRLEAMMALTNILETIVRV